VVVSTNRVTRMTVATGRPAPAAPRAPSNASAPGGAAFDAGGFARNLLGKLQNSGGLVTAKGATGTGTSGAGSPNEFGWYFSLIFQEMYGAWDPPLGLPEGLVTRVLIRVEKTGVISKVSLANSSGNKSMDDSALAAAHRVKKLPPPPDGLGDRFAEFTIGFKIQKQ
jgi:TonB family protein